MWTISDFPAYAMLSGWSTKGKFACLCCNYNTNSHYLKHSRKMCYMDPPLLKGTDVLHNLKDFENEFGKKIKRSNNGPWKKTINFLSYLTGSITCYTTTLM